LGGLVCDATTPVAFGTHALLFAAAHLILFHLRDRLPKEDNLGLVIVVLFANLALFLVFSLGQIRSSPSPAAVWPRLIADLACTQIFLALVTPWFFALQAQALALARVPREQGA
jgi:rod shape-determining protein MreD